jgi:hypothetical protein
MQIGSRFTEYGLTGGFFWICQLGVIWWSGHIQAVLSNLSPVQKQLDGFSSVGSTALSALAIIAVFVTGLLLDLLAVYFQPSEMKIFHRHLVRNREWLGRLIADHKAYCEADYEEFERLFGESSVTKDKLAGFRELFFWNRECRQQFVATLKRNWGWKMARHYQRLWSFFTSYVLVQSGSSELSLMVDQYHLWRTGRAVSTVLLIVYVEVWFVLPIFLRARTLPFSGMLLMLALFGIAFMIMRETYSRLCFTLLALVYVTGQTRSAREE